MAAVRAFSEARVRPFGVCFRPIVDADYPFLVALYAETRAEEMAIVPWSDEEKANFLARQFGLQDKHYRKVYKGADLLLIESAEEPIGRAYVYRSAAEIRLMEITLVATWRNRGIGSTLLRELIEEARSADAQVTLHIEPENPAQRLYQRLGFRLIEHRGAYDFLGWRVPD